MILERNLKDLLDRHLAPSLVKRVLAEPSLVQLRGERRTITTLFVDAAGIGFTMEKLDPEQSVRYLNEYLEAVHQVILDHDGFMDKVVGDEIMAFWGAPLPSEQHAESACRTAVAIRKRLAELSDDFRRRGLDPVHAHIGVNTGEAIVGSFGPSDHPAYTPMGHAVNLGARLVSEARRNSVDIAVSEFTREALATRTQNPDEEFALKALLPIETLMRKEPVKVYAVTA
jgi:adenylate cyclase